MGRYDLMSGKTADKVMDEWAWFNERCGDIALKDKSSWTAIESRFMDRKEEYLLRYEGKHFAARRIDNLALSIPDDPTPYQLNGVLRKAETLSIPNKDQYVVQEYSAMMSFFVDELQWMIDNLTKSGR